VQTELARLIAANTKRDGTIPTAVPNLHLYRYSRPTVCAKGVLSPALAIVAQGAKRVTLGEESYLYDANNYLVTSVDLPLTGNVTKASSEMPYLGIRYDLDVSEIVSLKIEGKIQAMRKRVSERGIYVSTMGPALLDVMVRFLRLLNNPQDIPVLAPLLNQELLYRLLHSDQGAVLEKIARATSQTRRIANVINWMKSNINEAISIDFLAELANISPSGLHVHFKRLTGMSPLQYHKQLRLQEARRLLVAESLDAATVAFQVGYKSPSQFNREYTRFFGRPPRRDTVHIQQQA
jgi:AraC-like DNA-binding protein